jgi:small subunit ribosomal protein S20
MANMPQTTGAIRKLRADKKKAAVNLVIKKKYKQIIADFKKKPTAKALVKLYSQVDRAAKKHVIHKNKAARLKSRLSKLVSGKKS